MSHAAEEEAEPENGTTKKSRRIWKFLVNFAISTVRLDRFLFSLSSLFVNGDDFVAEGSVSKRIYRQQRISKEGGFDRRVRLTLYRKLSFSFIMRGELFSRKSIELRR